nr:PREDICTED: uncharacterized protein LOC109030962 [Bemisia tabaci]
MSHANPTHIVPFSINTFISSLDVLNFEESWKRRDLMGDDRVRRCIPGSRCAAGVWRGARNLSRRRTDAKRAGGGRGRGVWIGPGGGPAEGEAAASPRRAASPGFSGFCARARKSATVEEGTDKREAPLGLREPWIQPTLAELKQTALVRRWLQEQRRLQDQKLQELKLQEQKLQEQKHHHNNNNLFNNNNNNSPPDIKVMPMLLQHPSAGLRAHHDPEPQPLDFSVSSKFNGTRIPHRTIHSFLRTSSSSSDEEPPHSESPVRSESDTCEPGIRSKSLHGGKVWLDDPADLPWRSPQREEDRLERCDRDRKIGRLDDDLVKPRLSPLSPDSPSPLPLGSLGYLS